MTCAHRRDSFCGKISVCNNLREYGITFTLTQRHGCMRESPEFNMELDMFGTVCKIVRCLRRVRIGAIGVSRAALNTVLYSEKLLERAGISTDTLDLSDAVRRVEKLRDRDERVRAKVNAIGAYVSMARIPAAAFSGKASGPDCAAGLVVIKPSGKGYVALMPDACTAVELATGRQLSGGTPSASTPHHLFLYQKALQLGGIIHTHSNNATAFAAAGRTIPCVLTAMADGFGGEIHCRPYVDHIGDHIASAIIKYRGRGPGILQGLHGVFTLYTTPARALKAGIMIQDAVRTVWLALQVGTPEPLPPHETGKWWTRYHSIYGQ